jgi:hypothetical protein
VIALQPLCFHGAIAFETALGPAYDG